ncbi:uncharacterized protein LOC126569942 [Anopheles aquasalis]|uniref:uncharacterized protein LOC126569942 n=1 Tax=Anopheles aquasalis TaxID=42839 RepID=UPI00215AD01A|nr:uncharacterized protein LOC126569942 [Anopheles aquasalis]
MSDSESSEDETTSKLLQAVDTSFLNETLYKKEPATKDAKEKNETSQIHPEKQLADGKKDAPKSNRYLLEEDSVFQSDLSVSDSMQKHMAAKVSKLIETIVSFDDTVTMKKKKVKEKTANESNGAVHLLSGFDTCIQLDLPEPQFVQLKPVQVRRRQVEQETNVEDSQQRLASVVCEPGTFSEETKHWKPKREKAVFHYQSKGNGVCEALPNMPPNEFTLSRIARKWDESKIRLWKGEKRAKKRPINV